MYRVGWMECPGTVDIEWGLICSFKSKFQLAYMQIGATPARPVLPKILYFCKGSVIQKDK